MGSPIVWRGRKAKVLAPDGILSSGAVVAKTTTYAIDDTDDVILCSAGSAFTVTLPTAVGITGRTYQIKKTDSSFNAVTIATTSSQTIDGVTTTTLNTQYESLTLVSDGSNWHIERRHIPSVWTSYTPSGFQGFGTTSNVQMFYKRVGDSIMVKGRFQAGTCTASEARLPLPTNLTSASTTYITSIHHAGPIAVSATVDSSTIPSHLLIEPSVTYFTFSYQILAASGITKRNPTDFLANNAVVTVASAPIPISGWNGSGALFMMNPWDIDSLQKQAAARAVPAALPLSAIRAPASIAPATFMAPSVANAALPAAAAAAPAAAGAAAGGTGLAGLLGVSNPAAMGIGAGLSLISGLLQSSAKKKAAYHQATADEKKGAASLEGDAAQRRSSTLRSLVRG